MFTITVTNRKGGSAKTTSSVNIAAELVQAGYRCLLIDMDPQGHAGLGLGVRDPIGQAAGINDLLDNSRQSLLRLIQQTSEKNLDFIPPGKQATRSKDVQQLKQMLQRKPMQQRYEMIIIDTPPSAGTAQTAALYAADAVLIPFLPTPLGRAGVDQILTDLALLQNQHKLEQKTFGLVPIMVDSRVRLDNHILADMILEHGVEKIFRGIRKNVKLAEAFESGKPVVDYAPHCRGAFDYHMLTEDIIGQWSLGKAQAATQQISTDNRVYHRLSPTSQSNNPRHPQRHRGIRLKSHCQNWNG